MLWNLHENDLNRCLEHIEQLELHFYNKNPTQRLLQNLYVSVFLRFFSINQLDCIIYEKNYADKRARPFDLLDFKTCPPAATRAL